MLLSELIPFLKTLHTAPKKGLSQNFLIDPNIVRKILSLAKIQPEDPVLEIGPGPGALTKALLDQGAQVYAVEKDPLFASALERLQNGRLWVSASDIQTFPLHQLPSQTKVVANLPYHITTAILERLFSHPFSTLTVMVQKEVAERILAKEGTKTFGSLTLFSQFHAKVDGFFHVGSACFYPKPKVDSTVLHFVLHPPPEIDPNLLFSLIHRAFQKRRKMLSSSLGYPKSQLQQALHSLTIREDARPEMLSLSQWIRLAKKMGELPPESPL